MNNKLIIWDWNGTLLNDIDTCVDCMNMMLSKRGMSLISYDMYKRIFTFPVQEYYKTLGFDFEKESFEKLSIEYIDLYKKESEKSPLQEGALPALDYFDSEGYKQIILSASEQAALINQIEQREISHFFDSVIGLNNIHAKSKVQNAINFISSSTLIFDRIILIGDTFHDLEVAQEINAECILVSNGHQFLDENKINGNASVVNSLRDITYLQI